MMPVSYPKSFFIIIQLPLSKTVRFVMITVCTEVDTRGTIDIMVNTSKRKSDTCILQL